MTARDAVLTLTASLSAALVIAGCGGSTAESPPSEDAGGAREAARETGSPTPDARRPVDTGAPRVDAKAPPPHDAGVDSNLPSGVVSPSGTQLVASLSVNLEALTSDGYAVYVDTSDNALSAVSVAGGEAPIVVATLDSDTDYVLTRNAFGASLGPAVAFWDSTETKLSLWTKSSGTQSLSTANTVGFVSVSADGTLVAFTDSVDPSTGNGSLVVEGTDGTNRQTVATNLQAGPTSSGAFNCPPIFFFAGSTLVTSACSAAAGDGGAEYAILTAYSSPSWSPAVLSMTNTGLVAGPTGASFAATGSLGLQYFAGPTENPITIDPLGVEPLFGPDGGSLVYAAYAADAGDAGTGTLRRATVKATPSVTSLESVPAEFGLSALSPDGAWLVGYSAVYMNQETNLFSGSALSSGDLVTVDSESNVLLQSANFTADGNHILYETPTPSGFGYDTATAPSAGGAPVTLVTGGGDYTPLAGSRVILEKSFVQGDPPSYGTADMVVSDLSQDGGNPQVIVSQANALWYFPTPDGTKLVYVWTYSPGALAGLWVTPIPE